MHLVHPATLAVLLFCVGLYGVLARRNTVLVLMSVELMLAAVSLNLVAFDVWLADELHSGQVFTLFLIALAAAEIGIGLAIVLLVYRRRGTVALDRLRALRDGPGAVAPPDEVHDPDARPAATADAAARGQEATP
ncbi:NADH-quinone oxidoreductase subunit NuoK [Streptomyces spiramenti]|uniref:NADH-quinone oxidoreductase subunit K n=1 Tax=Streptomyces spiramenti TaxID=2720606 RepID=A0ABX1AQF5_9ACTN|nr:NADH-quinone oxidoreductase subunit NuoK [Streptomyces spiramenti]NJP67648.1 NADH-quinone oxidoreductase subunit NuoK [Streptomyces spiramenti]